MIKVLFFRPHQSVGGGVVEFANSISSTVGPHISMEPFVVGIRPGRLGRFVRVLMPIYDSFRLINQFRTQRFDLYHINPSLTLDTVFRDGLFILLISVFTRGKILVLFHGWEHACHRRIVQNSLLLYWFQLTFGRADKLLVLAASIAKELKQMVIDERRIGVATMMFNGKDLAATSRRRCDDKFWILFLSRFVAEKGIHELLEAFIEVSHKYPQAILVLAGDGPEATIARQSSTRLGLSGRVQFPGYVTGLEKAQLLHDSDVFVLPSKREGCPIAMLEAMAAGLPIIATRTGAIPEIVISNQNGIILDSVSSSSIAAAIILYIEDAQARQATSDANRKLAWDRFEANCVSTEFAAQYQFLARDVI